MRRAGVPVALAVAVLAAASCEDRDAALDRAMSEQEQEHDLADVVGDGRDGEAEQVPDPNQEVVQRMRLAAAPGRVIYEPPTYLGDPARSPGQPLAGEPTSPPGPPPPGRETAPGQPTMGAPIDTARAAGDTAHPPGHTGGTPPAAPADTTST